MTAELRSFRKAVIFIVVPVFHCLQPYSCYYYYCYYCYYFSYFMTAEPRSFRKAVIFIIVIINCYYIVFVLWQQSCDPFGRLWSLLLLLLLYIVDNHIDDSIIRPYGRLSICILLLVSLLLLLLFVFVILITIIIVYSFIFMILLFALTEGCLSVFCYYYRYYCYYCYYLSYW
jgi:hypothetical protein